MLYQTLPIVKEKLLFELKAKTFQERNEQQQKNQPKSLTMSYTIIQKIQPEIRIIFQKYFSKLTLLTITNCDLRTFENFPYLPLLKQFDASKNGLQGTFQFLVKNRALQYIDVSDNYIKDPFRLQPLKAIRNITFCLKGNPVLNQNNNNLAKTFGGRILKEPKKKDSVKDEKEQEKQKQDEKLMNDQEILKKNSEEEKNDSSDSDEIIQPSIHVQIRRSTHEKERQSNSIRIKKPRFAVSSLAGKIREKLIPEGQLARMFLERQRLRKEQQELQKQILILGDDSNFVIRMQDDLQMQDNEDNENEEDEQDNEQAEQQIQEQQMNQQKSSSSQVQIQE